MATEQELRQSVVNVIQGWLGWNESNGKYKKIIDLYNTQKPLPRGYAVQYDDEWCATTVTAAGMQAGLHDIIYGECSCSQMVSLYKQAGSWMEDDGYRPQPGDIIMYYWKDGTNYAATDCTGAPNHVGIVEQVTGNTITVIEGNKGQAVARRTLAVNGRYIRGYCLPDYKSKAQEDNEEMTQDQFNKFMDTWLAEQAQKDTTQPWQAQAVENAKKAGFTDGLRPLAVPTRVELMAMILAAMPK